ncbi:MAG TPA: LamG-like jellyroll fold domain-containing protein [Polyangiaceae bacterium]
MRFRRYVQTGTRRRAASVEAVEGSASASRPTRRVAMLPWLALFLSACALGSAGCSSLDNGNNPGPADGAVDATPVGVDASADTSSGGGDATTGSDSATTGETSAPDSGQPDATSSDGAVADGTVTDAPNADVLGADALGSDATSVDAALPCIIDGGDASGDCCPDDPNKTQPGVCGCGVSDFDSDGDGVPDCLDGCPFDATKTAPGVCGCGTPDVDTDGDGVLDCLDGCPKNAMMTAPGVCGCGGPDNTPLCLVHRYSFKDGPAADAGATDAGAGTTVVSDSIGHADGTAVNVTLTGAGSVTLAGTTSNQYISLPSGIISALGDNATFEAFLTWPVAGGLWQRIFDFGSSTGGAGMQGNGTAFLFVTPLGGPGVMLASFLNGGLSEADSTVVFPNDALIHEMALVMSSPPSDGGAAPVDGGGPTMLLYVDGVLKASAPLANQLSVLPDVNNWLGRSQFAADPGIAATYYEFRIYSAARTAQELLTSTGLGHDVLPTQ